MSSATRPASAHPILRFQFMTLLECLADGDVVLQRIDAGHRIQIASDVETDRADWGSVP